MSTQAKTASKATPKNQPVRLYVKGAILGFKRSQVNQQNHTTLIKIEGVNDKKDVAFYQGKRIAYVYRVSKTDKSGSRCRVIWGRVSRPHGPNGVVKAKFRTNIPPKALGARVRVMLYPSRV